jgi:zinc protease
VQDATVPLVAMEYAFAGGSSQDPAGKPGTGSFTANMLDEGAADLDSKTFHERLERRAIEMSFSVTRDYLRGSMRMLKEHSDEAFGLLKLALTSPVRQRTAGTRPRADAIECAARKHQSGFDRGPQVLGTGLRHTSLRTRTERLA